MIILIFWHSYPEKKSIKDKNADVFAHIKLFYTFIVE
jgi:hypothetical protein